MDSLDDHDSSPELPDKGKQRAQEDVTERTPLLGQSSSQIESRVPRRPTTREGNRRRLRSRLTLVFLVSLSVCIVSFVLLALLAWSYAAKAAKISPDDIIQDALVFQGPEQIDVLNVTSGGEFMLKVNGKIGLDAGVAVGVNSELNDSGLFGLWKALGRWGIHRLDRVTVTPSIITIASTRHPGTTLASIHTSSFVLPLTANPPDDFSWLTPVSTIILVKPNNDTSTLLSFIRDGWQHGSIDIQANISQAIIQGGSIDDKTWRTWLRQEIVDVQASVHWLIPSIPGLPPPGRATPFPSVQDLVTLRSFSISSGLSSLIIRATATVVDPAPANVNFIAPHIPFIVSLPAPNPSHPPIPLASVSTAPFSLTHPNISLDISGTVLPLKNESMPLLSSFLSRYLSKKTNTIVISTPLIQNLFLQTNFPPPNPPPRILRNVTIKDMKVKPGTTFLASGIVSALVVLPHGINIDLIVSRVLPDVLVFDGEVPGSVEPFLSEPTLPDPLPEGAFGHIRPEEWLKAVSFRDVSGDGEGATYAVKAKLVDVPLEVLPGRQKEFSNFVSKVVFSLDGAVAGILGSAAVAVKVDGLPFSGPNGEMELSGLPFRGSVPVKKRSFLHLNSP